MQNDKLLPCPFCGGEPFVYTTGNVSCGFYVEIICENCGCRTDRAYEKVATEVWNTRKPMELIVEKVVAELEKEIEWANTHGADKSFRKGRVSGLNTGIRVIRNGGKE